MMGGEVVPTYVLISSKSGFPWWLSGKESTGNVGDVRERLRFDSRVRKIPWSRKCQPTPVFLPGDSHGQRSLAGYSSWGQTESDMTE